MARFFIDRPVFAWVLAIIVMLAGVLAITRAMVRFDTFATATWTSGSPRLERYNGSPATEIVGMARPGTSSSGEAMATMERLAATLPAGIGYEWTGISLQEKQSGSQAMYLYAASILIVFLCLAALYESWAIPLSVILVVPLGGSARWPARS